MVDFNNETTVTQGSSEIVKVTRLEKRYNLFEAMEAYLKLKFMDQLSGDELAVVKARAFNLVWEMEGELDRQSKEDLKPESVKKSILDAKDDAEVLKLISKLNLFLDDMGLTKIDIRKRYDKTRVEEENKEMGV